MTSGAVWKVILRFAFPLLIGNLLQQLYNVTDSVIVGQFLGKESLAAVSASFFIYYFIISLVIGIGSGTSVVISQFFGAKEFDKVQKAFSSFFIFMLVSGVLLSIAGIIFAEPMFRLTNTPEDVIPQAGVGIENIFKFLRLDYVWRLTYKDHPGIQTKGIRFMMKLSF